MTSIIIDADIRNEFGSVRDQGLRPTCLAFATSAAHERTHQLKDQLSVEWLYYHALKGTASQAADGLSIAEVSSAVEQPGQPDEQHWPYQKTFNLAAWKAPTLPPGKLWRAMAGTVPVADIPARLDAGVAVVIAAVVGSGFISANGKIVQSEFVLDDDPEPVSHGEGHALLVVGHGSVGASPHLLIRNSWGPKWASDGHAWISVAEVKKRWIGGFQLGAKT